MLVSKKPTQNVADLMLSLCGPNTKPGGPNASQWNIICIGSLGVGACVGHVHFMLLCQFHLRWVVKANAISGGIWAYIYYQIYLIKAKTSQHCKIQGNHDWIPVRIVEKFVGLSQPYLRSKDSISLRLLYNLWPERFYRRKIL